MKDPISMSISNLSITHNRDGSHLGLQQEGRKIVGSLHDLYQANHQHTNSKILKSEAAKKNLTSSIRTRCEAAAATTTSTERHG